MDSPVARNHGAVSSYEFDSQNERNAVNLTKIKNFSFSQGFGGTLTLGGAGNGNGLMLVKDASGSTVVRADNQGINIFGTAGGTIVSLNENGILVNGGNITVNNENGSVVLDSFGIRSTTQFPNNQLVSNPNGTTASTSFVDLTGSSFTITAERDINVLFNILVTARSTEENYIFNQYGVATQLYDSFLAGPAISNPITYGYAATRADIDGGGTLTGFTYSTNASPTSVSAILLVQEGTHNYKLQFAASGGGTALVNAFIVNYIILGQ